MTGFYVCILSFIAIYLKYQLKLTLILMTLRPIIILNYVDEVFNYQFKIKKGTIIF